MDESDSEQSFCESLNDSSSEWNTDGSESDSDYENHHRTPPPMKPLRCRLNNAPNGTGVDVGTYEDRDTGPKDAIRQFQPKEKVGLHLPDVLTRDDLRQYLSLLVVFKLFICLQMVEQICQYTNANAERLRHVKEKAYKHWVDVSPDEMYKFIGLLLYMSIVQAPSITRFWSTKQLYHGFWARAFMSRGRYEQIQTFFKDF